MSTVKKCPFGKVWCPRIGKIKGNSYRANVNDNMTMHANIESVKRTTLSDLPTL